MNPAKIFQSPSWLDDWLCTAMTKRQTTLSASSQLPQSTGFEPSLPFRMNVSQPPAYPLGHMCRHLNGSDLSNALFSLTADYVRDVQVHSVRFEGVGGRVTSLLFSTAGMCGFIVGNRGSTADRSRGASPPRDGISGCMILKCISFPRVIYWVWDLALSCRSRVPLLLTNAYILESVCQMVFLVRVGLWTDCLTKFQSCSENTVCTSPQTMSPGFGKCFQRHICHCHTADFPFIILGTNFVARKCSLF